jgi:hypothetical protein
LGGAGDRGDEQDEKGETKHGLPHLSV